MKVTIDATATRFAPKGYFRIVPREKPSRAQEMCNVGIFNLMGIKKAGTYIITCKKVRAKRVRREDPQLREGRGGTAGI